MSARMLNEEDVKKSVKKAISEERLVSEDRLRQIVREELQNIEKEEQEQSKKSLWDYFMVFVNEDKLPIYVLHHFTTFSKKYIVQGTLMYNPVFDSEKIQTPLEPLFYKGFTAVLLCFQI